MLDSVRGFDIERSENNVDLQEQKPGLDNLQAAADAALNGRAEPAFDHERARVHRRRRASPWAPPGRMSAARESRVDDAILHLRQPFGTPELRCHSSDA